MKQMMKPIFLRILVLVVVVGSSVLKLSAQTDVQTIGLTLPGGVHYAYEWALANKITLTGRGGFTGSIGYCNTHNDHHDSHWYFSLHPYFEIEPRYYYKMMGGSNKGNYFSVKTGVVFDPIIECNDKGSSGAFFTPCWGLRRSLGKDWLFDFQAGLALGNNYYNHDDVGIYIGLTFAYKL